MKKINTIIIITLLTLCNISFAQDVKLKVYENFLKLLDGKKITSVNLAVVFYKEWAVGANQVQLDSAFVIYRNFHYKVSVANFIKYMLKLKENKIDYKQVTSVSGNILSKIIVLYYLLDYCSIYKAIMNGIDPTPIKSIDFVKSKL